MIDNEKVIREIGTPTYVYDVVTILDRIKYLRGKLDADILYAVKANSFIVKEIEEEIDGYEICSKGEFDICNSLGINRDKMVISGVHKDRPSIEEMIESYDDIRKYTIESVNQWKLLTEVAKKYGRHIHALIRLTSGNQFGVCEEDLKYIIGHNDETVIEIDGIEYFSGTQKHSIKKINKEADKLITLIDTIREELGFTVREIEYGPGIGVDYFADKAAKYIEADFFEALTEAAKPLRQKYRVTLEMGRALAAPCGEYVSRIVDCKVNGGTGYVLIDGGSHQVHYDGMMRGMHVPHLRTIPARKGDQAWTIAGSLCSVNDILASQARLGAVQIGDCLVFENAGAYAMDEGPALFLSHELPAVYAVKGQAVRVLRRRMDTWPMHVDIEEDNQ